MCLVSQCIRIFGFKKTNILIFGFFLSDRSTSKKNVGEVFFSVSMGKGVMRGETRCGGNDTSFPAALPRSLAQSKCRPDFFGFS